MTHHEKDDEKRRRAAPTARAGEPVESEDEEQKNTGVNAGVGPMDQVRTPSQAEGERDVAEDDLAEQGSGALRQDDEVAAGSGPNDVWNTPSQAEGDRDTVERNLRRKEQKDKGREQ